MLNLFGSKETPFDKWVKTYPKNSTDDIKSIDNYFKNPSLNLSLNLAQRKVAARPFINITADSMIYLPAWSIASQRKRKEISKNKYYTDNSVIEISVYLLFYSRFMCEGSDKISDNVHNLVRERFFLTLSKVAGRDYSKYFDGRSNIYQKTTIADHRKLLLKFLKDTKMTGEIRYHNTSEKDTRIDINKPEDFHLLNDYDLFGYALFEVYLLEVVPTLEKEVDKKITEWFYYHLDI